MPPARSTRQREAEPEVETASEVPEKPVKPKRIAKKKVESVAPGSSTDNTTPGSIKPPARTARLKNLGPVVEATGETPEPIPKPAKTTKKKTHTKVPSPSENVTDIEDVVPKKSKWEPENWLKILDGVRKMRRNRDAPVDTMGCQQVSEEDSDPRVQRFQVLISLLLSSQTRDEVNYAACSRLRELGFTPEKLKDTDEETIAKTLYPVGFYKTKAKNVRKVAEICFDRYGSDIPHSLAELCELPGVGPKMAYLAMSCAWKETIGIGVDTHVHRLAQRWKWLPKGATKSPEDTRQQLESWLPSELWEELNWLLVGFGQTICSPVGPKCGACLVNDVCPNAFKEVRDKSKSPEKKKTGVKSTVKSTA